ncbi:MAG: hypothetical protein K6E54_01735 [Bacteroidaceae bacterium]|nr:hypothetical protein [Bacteroidaceae bacterium]
MKVKVLFTILVAGLCLASCSTKSSAVSDLRSLSNDIQENGSTYTVEEWKAVKNKFEKVSEKINKYEYTAEEYEEIGELKGKCVAYFAKGVVNNVTNKITNVANQIKGVVNGVKDAFKTDNKQ